MSESTESTKQPFLLSLNRAKRISRDRAYPACGQLTPKEAASRSHRGGERATKTKRATRCGLPTEARERDAAEVIANDKRRHEAWLSRVPTMGAPPLGETLASREFARMRAVEQSWREEIELAERLERVRTPIQLAAPPKPARPKLAARPRVPSVISHAAMPGYSPARRVFRPGYQS